MEIPLSKQNANYIISGTVLKYMQNNSAIEWNLIRLISENQKPIKIFPIK